MYVLSHSSTGEKEPGCGRRDSQADNTSDIHPGEGHLHSTQVLPQGLVASAYGELVSYGGGLLFSRDLLTVFDVAREGDDGLLHAWLCHEIDSLLIHGIC